MPFTKGGKFASNPAVGKRMDDADSTGSKPKGKLRRLSVEPADNGYSVDVDRDLPAKKGGKDDSISFRPPDKSVFNNKADVLAHIEKHLD